MSQGQAGALRRQDMYAAPLIDGRPVSGDAAGRVRRRVQRALVSDA